MIKIVTFCVVILCALADPPTPFWGGNPIFTTNFKINVKSPYSDNATWTAKYYYNSNLKAERYEYDEGQFDEMCWASGAKFWEKIKCNVIHASNGWSYVQFPTQPWCCKCSDYFGAVRYDWLQEDSNYIGRETVNGVQADHWLKYGNPRIHFPNEYYATVGAQLPVKFYEINTNKTGWKEIDFDLSTYSTAPINNTLFDPPANCQTMCPGYCRNITGQASPNLKFE